MKNRIISPGQVWLSDREHPIVKDYWGDIAFITLSYVEKNYEKRILDKNPEWNVVRFHAWSCDGVIETMDEETLLKLKYMDKLRLMKKYYKIRKLNKNLVGLIEKTIKDGSLKEMNKPPIEGEKLIWKNMQSQ